MGVHSVRGAARRRSPLVSGVLGILALTGSSTAQAEPDAIHVLLLTGANNHHWEHTSAAHERLLEQDGRFAVEVATDPAAALADPAALADVDVFLLDYNGPRWGEPAETHFLDAVRGGTGVAVVHAANNAFEGWVEYERLVGLCWREGTGHGSFHAFDVRMDDRGHPITHGLPDMQAHPDELYHGLVPMHGAQGRVLATAVSDPETGGTGAREPMIIVDTYGAGRVFHTPLGHVWRDDEASRASVADGAFATLLRRGVEWAATGRVTDGLARPNRLTRLERDAGWRLLFDGVSTSGWTGWNGLPPGDGWSVVDGCLRQTPGAGPLVSMARYGDFELAFEWKVTRGANSGVKYRVLPFDAEDADGNPFGRPMGLEYQVLDDAVHGDAANPSTSAAALYSLSQPLDKPDGVPAGSFHQGRIVVRRGMLEHWLDGHRVVRAPLAGPAWDYVLEASKYAGVPGFGQVAGPLVLQDHGDEVWYRSLRVRDLDEPSTARGDDARDVTLAPFVSGPFPERTSAEFPRDGAVTLGGDRDETDPSDPHWFDIGDARYLGAADEILGEVDGGGQSFLVSRREFGDFILEVDVKPELPGNSGIQIRSHLAENGRLFGYQIEIDSSERAWSGGLYDEGRRGWLDDLTDEPAARAAFRPGQWNHYRIEAVGPHIRTWIDGIPAADWIDTADLSGHLALQVHSGHDTRVRWRGLRIRDLGTRRWEPLLGDEGLAGWRVAPVADGRGWLVEGFEGGPRDVVWFGTARSQLSSEAVYEDACLVAGVVGNGPVGIGIRSAGVPLPDDVELATTDGPSLEFIPGWGWLARVGDARAVGERRVAVTALGSRLVVEVDGQVVAQLRDAGGPVAGRISFVTEPRGDGPGGVSLLDPAVLSGLR